MTVRSALLGLALIFAGLAACNKKPEANFERPPAPVTVARAVARDVPVYIDAVGKMVAREVVSIQPQVSGRITQIHFTDGANVKIGDLLFTIDPRPYQAQLNQAEANVAQAEAALSLAKVNFARVEKVSDPRAVSRQDYDARKSAVESAEATLKQNRAAVENARLNLEYCTIRSPINGRAGQRAVDVGNVVSANNGSLLVIQRLDPIYADFTVTESELSGVQRNMAKQALKVEVRLPDDGTEPREGKLTFLDNSVQEGIGYRQTARYTYQQRSAFLAGPVRQGSSDSGKLSAMRSWCRRKRRSCRLKVPSSTSLNRIRPRSCGRSNSGSGKATSWSSDEGLKAGERVVVSGQLGVTPGGKVRVVEPAAPAKAAPSANPPAKS